MIDATPSWVTFDCYGTLIDWESGIASLLYHIALNSDDAPPPGKLLREEWEAIQFDLIQGMYQPYKSVLSQSLRLWCTSRGYPYLSGYDDAIVQSMKSWQPFHDVIPALRRAQENGTKLAIISNTDHVLIAHSLNQMRIEFEEVIVAEDCQAYKPNPAVFELALNVIGAPPSDVLHVAFGFKYDIGPAADLGLRTGWVNRNAESLRGDFEPDHTWRDLWGLAALSGTPCDIP